MSASPIERALHLASRYQALGSLVMTTAHDVRDSLNSMTLSVELLARTLEAGIHSEREAAVRQQCVKALRQELTRLAQSVTTVLDEGRIDFPAAARVRVTDVLESVISLLRARAEYQRVALRFDAPTGTIDVVGRPDELRQAVFNLAINAFEAMPDGGDLTFDLRTEGESAVLRISDTGSGVPEHLRPRIWDLWFSTKSQGLGLGLHVVRNVVQSHGGTVALDQTETGTRFIIRLPLAG